MKKCIKKDTPNCSPTCPSSSVPQRDDIILCDNDITLSEKLQHEVDNDFLPKKINSMKVGDCFEFISTHYDLLNTPENFNHYKSRALNVHTCGTYLEFHTSNNNSRLAKANFCKDRLCPMCNWRRSKKVFHQVSRVMNELEKGGKYEYLFLTLTVKNCRSEDLKQTIDQIYLGWRNMYHEKRVFKSIVVGSFRALEITYNRAKDEWHPHLHVILVVDKYYFSHHYMTQDDWCNLWMNAVDVDYKPICDIRKISKGANIQKSVAEVSKYAVKDSDYLKGFNVEQSSNLIEILAPVLKGRRLCAFTGVMLKVAKQLQLDDLENGNLIIVDDDEIREDLNYIVTTYHWQYGCYERRKNEVKKKLC